MSRPLFFALVGGCAAVLALEGTALFRSLDDHPFDDTVRQVRELAAADEAAASTPGVVVATRGDLSPR